MTFIGKLSCVLLLAAVTSANYITYSNCTDKALCFSGCTISTLPEGQCLPNGEIGTQMFKCNPTLQLCGDMTYYSDEKCTLVQATQGWVCDQCDIETKQMLSCDIKNGKQFITVNECTDGCKSCFSTGTTLAAGDCVPIKSNGGNIKFMRYTGVAPCDVVHASGWNNPDCSGAPTAQKVFPADSCMNGGRLSCTFD